MNILITAGGTIEPIDNVRSITNTGTGKLGSLIADEFLGCDQVDKLFYVCTDKAVIPKSEKATILNIKSVDDLQDCVLDVISNNRIDVIVHSMAVSDYTVRSVTDMGSLSEIFTEYLKQNKGDPADTERYLLEKFDECNLAGDNGKISSQLKYPLIMLDKTPKVLPLFRKHSPDSIIIGFKLLSEVPKDELLDVAHSLLHANGCDFVLANDEAQIKEDKHEGYLLDEDKSIISFDTKQEIAAGLVTAVLERVRK